jgi:hypothetical protein
MAFNFFISFKIHLIKRFIHLQSWKKEEFDCLCAKGMCLDRVIARPFHSLIIYWGQFILLRFMGVLDKHPIIRFFYIIEISEKIVRPRSSIKKCCKTIQIKN